MSKIKNNINNCTTIFIFYNYSDLPFQNNCNEIYSFFIKYIVSFLCVCIWQGYFESKRHTIP